MTVHARVPHIIEPGEDFAVADRIDGDSVELRKL
jgi:hypothetical protein